MTAEEVADPHALNLQLSVNGTVLQNSNTENITDDFGDIVEVGTYCTMIHAAIVATGAPGGVGP
jgi:2-keto-4-pentenoate hydratase/2-oxohepta-3-ene-1,7-dioic acid hydratase in catechol pathway